MRPDNTQPRAGKTADMLPDEIAATIQRTWGEAANFPARIDATVSLQVTPAAPPRQNVVVSERRVREAEQPDPGDTEYELDRILGRGGMGVVYQARQASIGRSVAVKMLKSGTTEDVGRQHKFIEEAAVTGELDHPNIVPIYDLGQTSQGQLFYAMKQVRGTPWKDVLRQRSLSENLHVLIRVADAIAFAHSRGVVHRDLKPENIMLGEFGEVLVMDWGLAIATSSGGEGAGMGGTPCYMAPEMVTGPTSAIGPHSDIYLLGAILYEIVTGKPPHLGESAAQCLAAAARNEITPTSQEGELVDIALHALATCPTDRFPTVQDFQAAIRQYESHTESIAAAARAREELAKATRDNDYDRFAAALFGFQNAIELWDRNPDAHAGLLKTRQAYADAALGKGDYDLGLSIVGADLDQHQELRQRLLDAQQERDARQQRLRSVRRTAAGLALGLVVVMSVALVWIMRAERQTRLQRDIARVQQQLARDAVDQMLTEVGQQQLEDVPQMESVRRSLLNKALTFYLRFLDEQPDDPSLRVETARAYHRVGDISTMLGRQQEAEEAYQRAITLFKQLASEFPDRPVYSQQLAASQNFLGELYRTIGDNEPAEFQYLQALRQQRELVETSPQAPAYRQEMARTSYNLGLLYWSMNQPEKARDAYDRAIDVLSRLVESQGHDVKNKQGLARAHLNRGFLNRGTDHLEQARQDYDRAITLLRELTEAAPKTAEYRYELATVLNNLGNLLLSDKSKRVETEHVYRDGLSLLEKLTDDFPSVLSYRKELANAVNSLAALHYFSEEFDAAEQMWQRSRELARELVADQPGVPENHSLLGRTLGNLGSLMFKRKDFESARNYLQEAIASQEAALETNPEHPGFRSFLRNYTWSLAEAQLALKDHEAAARTAEKLPEIMRDDAAELYRAASLIARSVPLAADPPAGQEFSEIQEDYTTRSMQLLSRAVDHGFSDVARLDADEAFAAIRDRGEFKHLRQRLQPPADVVIP